MAPNLELRLLRDRTGSDRRLCLQTSMLHPCKPRQPAALYTRVHHAPVVTYSSIPLPRRAHPSNNRAPHPRHSAEHLSTSSTRANVEPTAGFGHGHQSSSYYLRWTYRWHEPSSSTTVGASSDISALLSQRAVKPDSKRSIRLHPSTYYNCQEI